MHRLRHGYRHDHRARLTTPADISLTARYTAALWESIGLPHAARFADFRGRFLLRASLAGGALIPRGVGRAHLDAGLIPRHLYMDDWVRRNGFKQVIEIAAGFSPRGLMFANEGIRYIEVDRPRVMDDKRRMSKGAPAMPVHLGLDATQADFTARILEQVDPSLTTAILNEGMSPYFAREHYVPVLKTIRGLAETLDARFLTDIYRAAKGETLLKLWFDVGSVAIAAVADKVHLYVRNEADIRALFGEAGWKQVSLATPAAEGRFTLGRTPAVANWLYLVEAR